MNASGQELDKSSVELPVLADGAYAVAFIDGLNPVPVVKIIRGQRLRLRSTHRVRQMRQI